MSLQEIHTMAILAQLHKEKGRCSTKDHILEEVEEIYLCPDHVDFLTKAEGSDSVTVGRQRGEWILYSLDKEGLVEEEGEGFVINPRGICRFLDYMARLDFMMLEDDGDGKKAMKIITREKGLAQLQAMVVQVEGEMIQFLATGAKTLSK